MWWTSGKDFDDIARNESRASRQDRGESHHNAAQQRRTDSYPRATSRDQLTVTSALRSLGRSRRTSGCPGDYRANWLARTAATTNSATGARLRLWYAVVRGRACVDVVIIAKKKAVEGACWRYARLVSVSNRLCLIVSHYVNHCERE